MPFPVLTGQPSYKSTIIFSDDSSIRRNRIEIWRVLDGLNAAFTSLSIPKIDLKKWVFSMTEYTEFMNM